MKIPGLYKIVNKEVLPMDDRDLPVSDIDYIFREAGHDPTDVYTIIVTDRSIPVSDIYISKKTLQPFMMCARVGEIPTYEDCEKALRSVDWQLEMKLQEHAGR